MNINNTHTKLQTEIADVMPNVIVARETHASTIRILKKFFGLLSHSIILIVALRLAFLMQFIG